MATVVCGGSGGAGGDGGMGEHEFAVGVCDVALVPLLLRLRRLLRLLRLLRLVTTLAIFGKLCICCHHLSSDSAAASTSVHCVHNRRPPFQSDS